MGIYRALLILLFVAEGSSVAFDSARESQYTTSTHLSSNSAHHNGDFPLMAGMQQMLTQMPSAMQQQLKQVMGSGRVNVENAASPPTGLSERSGLQSGFNAIMQQLLPGVVSSTGTFQDASINGMAKSLLQTQVSGTSGSNVDSNRVPNWNGMMSLPPQLEQMQASLSPISQTNVEEISQKVSLQEMMKPQLDMLGIDAKQVLSGPGNLDLHQHLVQTDSKGGTQLQSGSQFTGVPGVPLQYGVGGLSAAVGMYSPYVNPFIFPLTPHKYMPPPPGPAPYPMPSFDPPNYYNPSNDFVGL